MAKRKRRRPPSESHVRLETAPAMPRRHIQFTAELWDVLDELRGHQSTSAWLEAFLRRTRRVRETASEIGVKLPERNPQGRPRVRDYQ